jgi:hypothetical protein
MDEHIARSPRISLRALARRYHKSPYGLECLIQESPPLRRFQVGRQLYSRQILPILDDMSRRSLRLHVAPRELPAEGGEGDGQGEPDAEER